MVSKRKSLVRAVDEKVAESIAKVFGTEPVVIEDSATDKLKRMSQSIGSAAVTGKAMCIASRRLPSYQGPTEDGRSKGDAELEL